MGPPDADDRPRPGDDSRRGRPEATTTIGATHFRSGG